MSTQDEEMLRRIVRKAKEVTPADATVILYGSRARGDNRPDSDWDLLIVLNKDRVSLDDIDRVAYPLREEGWDYGADINPIIYSKKAWQASSFTPFYKNVMQDGITI